MTSSILANLQANGEGELCKLLEVQRTHLRRFVDCRINPKLFSRLDASDIIQEVYVRAYRGLENYLASPVVPPLIWLRRLSKQILCEAHRKQFRTVRSPYQEQNDIDDQFIGQMIDSNDSVRTEVERREVAEKIRGLLTQLSELDREVIEMRHMDGYSIREIADLLEVNQEAIKKRYYRALERFREILSNDPNFNSSSVAPLSPSPLSPSPLSPSPQPPSPQPT